MLPKELLDVKRVKGKIYPKFATAEDIKLAKKIIEIFEKCKGKKYKVVLEILSSIEDAENYKKVRGFTKILEKFSEFEVKSPVDPLKLRFFLFEKGYVVTPEERDTLVKAASENFGISPEDVVKYMYADLDEEKILSKTKEISAEDLMKFYNLSLLQTTLFDSLRMTFWTSSNHENIFRKIKMLGLMYEIFNSKVEITGPASILKMTRKYGTSMAKLVPSIIKSEKWEIFAEILFDSKIYFLEIGDSLKHLFPEFEEEIEYDSSLEEEFERKVKIILPELEIKKGSEIVKAGKRVFIPDFVIKKGEKKVYVEIAGFWTPEYIKRKVEKIREAKIPVILIARKDLAIKECKLEEKELVFFDRKLPFAEIVKKLKDHLLMEEIRIEGDIVKLSEIAERSSIQVSKIVEKISDDYLIIGNYAVKKEVYDELKRIFEKADVSEVESILKTYKVGYDLLEHFGYKVVWTSLNEFKIIKI
ncbi:MAG: DUF790 family protein [Archaeoglobaceae archaeon]|nr:DUF790 family protein [Archaeoglobaceae archaeon]MCX8152746.1 DUF790 family protein [Archaeoglobaceae archaeon]MDW8013453.1 DUF790 family protein [Archaeoglobaceae archaeon]